MKRQLYAKYCHPNAGYESDKENCMSYLQLNYTYKVHSIDIGNWRTTIRLYDSEYDKVIKAVDFNSVNFEFYSKVGHEFIHINDIVDELSDRTVEEWCEADIDEEELTNRVNAMYNQEDSEAKHIENMIKEMIYPTKQKEIQQIDEKDLIGANIVYIDINNPQYQPQIIVEKEGTLYQLCGGNNGRIILSKIEREVR